MTERERITLESLDAKVTRGFDHINNRLANVERRSSFVEGDAEVLRFGEQKILTKIEALPCARHTADIAAIRKKVSEEVRCARDEHTTSKIEIAKLEAMQEARKEMLERQRMQMEMAMKASEVRWKRIAIVLTPLAGLVAVVVTAILKGCIG